MSYSFCLCGATSGGYPHKPDCPYPLYRGSEKQCRDWREARERLRQQARTLEKGGQS